MINERYRRRKRCIKCKKHYINRNLSEEVRKTLKEKCEFMPEDFTNAQACPFYEDFDVSWR